MAYTTIDKPSDYFNTKLYTGDGATSTAGTLARTISGVGFQSDWTWVKGRTSGGYNSHGLHDAVRGAPKWLGSDGSDQEYDVRTEFSAGGIGSFTSDGFGIFSGTAGTTTNYNTSSTTYVAWNWKAGGSASSNSNGSITSSVSANQDAGFSIVSYSGASSGGTIGHGLGVKPDIVLIKCRSATANWLFTTDIIDGSKDYLFLNQTNAKDNLTTALPTSSVFTVSGDDDQGENGKTYIAYCFNSVKGYSKFGSYTGNGNADGTFVYTGFKPAFVLTKSTSNAVNWQMQDNKTAPYNLMVNKLFANTSASQDTGSENTVDFLSNGFKPRGTGSSENINGNGYSYIYMAFAENPFVTSTGIPTTAR